MEVCIAGLSGVYEIIFSFKSASGNVLVVAKRTVNLTTPVFFSQGEILEFWWEPVLERSLIYFLGTRERRRQEALPLFVVCCQKNDDRDRGDK